MRLVLGRNESIEAVLSREYRYQINRWQVGASEGEEWVFFEKMEINEIYCGECVGNHVENLENIKNHKIAPRAIAMIYITNEHLIRNEGRNLRLQKWWGHRD